MLIMKLNYQLIRFRTFCQSSVVKSCRAFESAESRQKIFCPFYYKFLLKFFFHGFTRLVFTQISDLFTGITIEMN